MVSWIREAIKYQQKKKKITRQITKEHIKSPNKQRQPGPVLGADRHPGNCTRHKQNVWQKKKKKKKKKKKGAINSILPGQPRPPSPHTGIESKVPPSGRPAKAAGGRSNREKALHKINAQQTGPWYNREGQAQRQEPKENDSTRLGDHAQPCTRGVAPPPESFCATKTTETQK